jgi:hypothetical protein
MEFDEFLPKKDRLSLATALNRLLYLGERRFMTRRGRSFSAHLNNRWAFGSAAARRCSRNVAKCGCDQPLVPGEVVP